MDAYLELDCLRTASPYSYARDEMVIGSSLLKEIFPATQVPVAAPFVSGVLPALIIILDFFLQDAVAAIVSFAAIGICLAFQMIVFAALYARMKSRWFRGDY